MRIKIEQTKNDEEKATREGDLGKAAELRYGKRLDLQKERERLQKKLNGLTKDKKMLRQEVSEENIAQIVAQWTSIPVTRLLEGEKEKILEMEDRIRVRVIGQDNALHLVSNAIRRARSGIQDPNRPIGSFIFLGPTGVGKTETAKALAEFLFDSEDALIRIDMSEYMEKHSVARLIGSPPGYVGYDEGGQLTEAVRRAPYSVILFDEIEKAHHDVFNILLQVLDDGRLTDGKGRTIDFRNTILIMTSNIGGSMIAEHKGDLNEDLISQIKKMLKSYFLPEFLNRVDDVVIFNFLSKENIKKIIDIQIRELNKILATKKVKVKLSNHAKEKLADIGFDPENGARPLKRAIQRNIQDMLATALLTGDIQEGQIQLIDVDKSGNFIFK